MTTPGEGDRVPDSEYVAAILNPKVAVEIGQLNGMIWWLATELATEDVGKGGDPRTWIGLAERHWTLGLRAQARFLYPTPDGLPTAGDGDVTRTLIERAKASLDLWDKTSAVEIEVLTGMTAAREAYYDAPELVAHLVAEIERLTASS